MPCDREAEHGREHDAGHGIDRERPRRGRQHQHGDACGELLTEPDRVAAALGRRPMAQAGAPEENDDHHARDQPGRPRLDADGSGPDERDQDPHGDRSQTRGAGPLDSSA